MDKSLSGRRSLRDQCKWDVWFVLLALREATVHEWVDAVRAKYPTRWSLQFVSDAMAELEREGAVLIDAQSRKRRVS